MKLKLSDELKGTKFNKLCLIEWNTFEPNMLLPALFWLIQSGGHDRAAVKGGSPKDLSNVSRYVTMLNEHTKVVGFNDEGGQRLLDKWVRSSLIQTSRVGRARTGEQILYLHPLSFLTYKPTLSTHSNRLRRVHHFLYGLCIDFIDKQNGLKTHQRNIEKSMKAAFAVGVTLTEGPVKDGFYDGSSPLDLETLLQLYYLDGFNAPRERNQMRELTPVPACKHAASFIARDFIAFLEVYAKRVSATVLANYLLCLLNFELLIYTLRLSRATSDLVQRNQAPPEFDPESQTLSPLELYADLTQTRGSRSDMLAHQCVNRDLEGLDEFYRSSIMLRTLDRYISRNSDLESQLTATQGGAYMIALHGLRDDSDVRADARRELSDIKNAFTGEIDQEIPSDVQAIIDDTEKTTLERVVEILALINRKEAATKIITWFSDVGGIERSDGILRGNTRGKRRWSYVISDTLLETLVQLAAISPDTRHNSGNPIGSGEPAPDSITLSAFLRFLEERFGILIDRPPRFDDSIEAKAAAKDNFAALKQRLHQMGLFLDLSDDFNAQRIFPRFMTAPDATPTPTPNTLRITNAEALNSEQEATR